MYLSSFIHREELFHIAQRWFCGRMEPDDALKLTQILICDGFVLGQTLQRVTRTLLGRICADCMHEEPIRIKGQLRDALCRSPRVFTPRTRELCREYRANPEYYYAEVPINGALYTDSNHALWGVYRIKRPRRIAEKANRKIAQWIFERVRHRSQEMALERAHRYDIPLDRLVTPENEMVEEFIQAEKVIARSFSDGTMSLDPSVMTIHDVGGIKVVADREDLDFLEKSLSANSDWKVLDRENFRGDYRAVSLILQVPWEREEVCRQYRETRSWRKYLNRGIGEDELKKGLEPLLENAEAHLNLELILSTFEDLVESELGNSIHEERITAQREARVYKGYIPMNVEFLLGYLFAVGFSPRVRIDSLPVRLWGRYLPDTLLSHFRRLYSLPEYDLLS